MSSTYLSEVGFVGESSIQYISDTTEGSTFESPKLAAWTEQHLEDASRILNPTAGNAKLDVEGEVVRVDVCEDADADLHMDFRNLLEVVDEESMSGIVYDPPYSYNQAVSKYGLDLDRDEFYFYNRGVQDLFHQLLEPGGCIIQFGYTTKAMPAEYNYRIRDVAVFNKLGAQNDYLGVVMEKPSEEGQSTSKYRARDKAIPNNGLTEQIDKGVSKTGNGGVPISMSYRREQQNKNELIEEEVLDWVSPDDNVLHLYGSSPRFDLSCGDVVECRYDCIDLDDECAGGTPDLTVAPWNIGSKFATGVFDVVILDLPYKAFQQSIRTPDANNQPGNGRTHVHSTIKQSVSPLVDGNGGKVVQIGRTATAMSGIDFEYTRVGVNVLEADNADTARILSVDEKRHENLEVAGLTDGPVDRYGGYSIRFGTGDSGQAVATKHDRTEGDGEDGRFFCIHCGNHFYFHPAYYIDCVECGARPEERCRSDDGGILRKQIHEERVAEANEKHNGNCNQKERMLIEASDARVQEVANKLETTFSDRAAITREVVADCIDESPRSTDIISQVLEEIHGSNEGNVERTESPTSIATSDASLTDFA
jgi:hypothetical protein